MLEISENQRIKLDIFANFLKKKHFLHFKTITFFYSVLQILKEFDTFQSNSVYFFQVALCNQLTVVLYHWKRYRKGTYKPYSTRLWTIGFSTVTYINLWWSVKDLHESALRIYGARSAVDILKSDKNSALFDFIFPVLSNFK